MLVELYGADHAERKLRVMKPVYHWVFIGRALAAASTVWDCNPVHEEDAFLEPYFPNYLEQPFRLDPMMAPSAR
jgi:hypothetical protein